MQGKDLSVVTVTYGVSNSCNLACFDWPEREVVNEVSERKT